jgi:hypothetical protein
VVLLPCRGMAWRDATVPFIMALLAWWWFTNYSAQHDLVTAFIIISCSPSGIMAIVWEQVAAPGSLVAFIGHSASGLGLGLRSQNPRRLGRPRKSRPGLCTPSRSRWSRTLVLLGWIWTVGCRTGHHRLAMLSCLHRGT